MTGVKRKEVKYRLAGKGGTLKVLYTRSYVFPLPNTTPLAQGLEDSLKNWKTFPEVGLRELAKAASVVGGQGHTHCSCKKGKCDGPACKCFKAGLKCNSRCHKGNKFCKNHD